MNIEAQIKSAAEKAVLHFIGQGGWLMPNYEARLNVPPEMLHEAWALVDRAKLREQITARIESELAERIVNHIAAELATDIKQILSVKERREAIRSLARVHMDSIMSAGAAQ